MKIIKITGAVIGAIIVVGVLYLFLADFSKYQPDIEAAVTEATGREFQINGEFDLRPLPSPYVLIKDATLANAPWSDEASMLEIGTLSVKVGLWSLLFGPVVVKDLQFHDINVLLESNADGASNLDFDVPEEEPPVEEEEATSVEPPVVLRDAEVSNVTVTLRQPASDDMVFDLESLTVLTDEDDTQVIVGSAAFLERALTLDGIIANQQADINATFGNILYHSVTQHRGPEADIDITISRLTDVGDVLEISNLPAEDLTLAGNVVLRKQRLWLQDVTIGIATAQLVINGSMGGSDNVQLELLADAPSLAVLGQGLPDIPMTGSATVLMAPNSLAVEPFEAAFGESDFSGYLKSTGGSGPSFTLQAKSALLDLRPFAAEEEDAAAEGSGDDEAESPYVFIDEPLPLERWQALVTDVDVTIDRVQGRTSHFNDVSVLVDASNGLIESTASFKGGRGGNFENTFELRVSETTANLTVDAVASELKLGALSGDGVSDEQVPTTELKMGVTASGASPRQLAASTNGRMLLTQGPGRIKNEFVGMLSGDLFAQLFSALNPFSADEEYSNWDCSIFAIDFVAGEGDVSGFLLQGEKIMVVGGGKLDLNTEKLNIEFNTKPRAGVGISADMFVTPFVKLSGTLADPSVGLNKKGVLLEGGLAVMTGGLSFLYKGVVDRATAEADQCEKTLQEINAQLPQ